MTTSITTTNPVRADHDVVESRDASRTSSPRGWAFAGAAAVCLARSAP